MTRDAMVRVIQEYMDACGQALWRNPGNPYLIYSITVTGGVEEGPVIIGGGSGSGGYPEEIPVSQTNFSVRIMTEEFKRRMQDRIGIAPNSVPISFIQEDCTPTAFAQYSIKDERINICAKIFEYGFTEIDIQAIVFHEYVHAWQHDIGKAPEIDQNGQIIMIKLTFPIDDEFIAQKKDEFYENMVVLNVPLDFSERTPEQQILWESYENILFTPWVTAKENGENYSVDANIKQLVGEKEAYEKEFMEFESEMSPKRLEIAKSSYKNYLRIYNKIFNNK